MATTTKAALRELIGEELGDHFESTTTAAGNTLQVVDTELTNVLGGDQDDYFIGWYVLMTGGAASGESRRVTDYTASTGTLIVNLAFSATTGSGSTYELRRYTYADIDNAIEEAVSTVYPALYLSHINETLKIDNLLTNWDMETFSGGFTGWTEVGSPTVTEENTIVFQGTSSAKVVSSGADGQLTQIATQYDIVDLKGKTVVLEGVVYSTATDKGRLRLDWDGTNFENHSYNGKTYEWERQRLVAQVPDSATQVKAIAEGLDGSTVYWDDLSLVIDPINEYTIPAAILNVQKVSEQAHQDRPNGYYRPFGMHDLPTAGRILRIEGTGLLSVPTTEAATVEVGEPQVRLLVAYAVAIVYRTLASPARSAGLQNETYREMHREWSQKAETMRQMLHYRMRKRGMPRVDGTYYLAEDSSGRYLHFNQTRGYAIPPSVST